MSEFENENIELLGFDSDAHLEAVISEGHAKACSLLPANQQPPKQPPSPPLHTPAWSGPLTCAVALAASSGFLLNLFNHFAVRFTFQNTDLAPSHSTSNVLSGSLFIAGQRPVP